MRFAILAIGLLVFGGRTFAADDPAVAAQGAFEKWVEVQESIARDKREWSIEQEFLNEEVRLLKEEVAALKEKSTRLESETAELERELERMDGESQNLKESSGRLTTEATRLEAALSDLWPRLPGALQESLEPLIQRLPRDLANSKAGVSERMQVIVGLLSQVDRFNGVLTVVPELRQNANGRDMQVRTLYLGLSQAWYVSLDGSFAGHGRPGPQGWDWAPVSEAAAAIKQAIDIQQATGVARYVSLPAKVN